MSSVCSESAAAGQAFIFVGETAACAEPAHKELFCSALATPRGYEGASVGLMGVDLARSAEFCGTDVETVRGGACRSALAAGSLQFVIDNCPESMAEVCAKALAVDDFQILADHCEKEAAELAQRECAGRRYSSEVKDRYRGFCSGWRMQAEGDAGSAEPPPEKAGIKKKLKGLLGR
jgi:hypothetical protein